MTRQPRWIAALVAFAMLAAACSGGDDGDDSTDLGIFPDRADSDIPEEENPFLEEDALPPPDVTRIIEPYTGVELDDAALLDRPAVAVKIDNDKLAWPQIGLADADIVFEIKIENNRTRFLAVYHSTLPDEVGPSRSARSSDLQILANMGAPLFGYAGSNAGVRSEVKAAGAAGSIQPFDLVIDLPGAYYRASDRPAPHNLIMRTADLLAAASDQPTAPQQIFGYAAEDEVIGQGGGVKLAYSSEALVEFVWDPERSQYVRFQLGAHLDANGEQIGVENVVVLEVNYGISSADAESPQAITVGSGNAIVLTRGGAVRALWSREVPTDPYTLTDLDGNAIALSPGRTWVALPGVEQSGIMTVSEAQRVRFLAAQLAAQQEDGE